jgi:hypothetical protein
MRRTLTTLLALAVLAAPTGARASTEVSVAELLADGQSFDGQSISIVGELVGDYGLRNDGSAWSQLNGDAYATTPLLEGGGLAGSNAGIGVRAPANLMADLDPPGGYHQRGPLVRVSGIWSYHDPERGGETYLDATSVEVLERGRALDETADPAVAAAGALLLLTALGLAYRSRSQAVA